MYSQNNEEEIIAAELARLGITTGNFLEIGAFDGRTFSNTLKLVEQGWHGVMVEPSPFVFPALVKNMAAYPNVHLVNAAVAPVCGQLVRWYDSGGDAISTTSMAHKQKWEAGSAVRFTPFFVYTMPLTLLFLQFGHGFTFINIDVESTNLELFMALPLENLTATRLICIEHDGQQDAIMDRAREHGYARIAINAENLIMSR